MGRTTIVQTKTSKFFLYISLHRHARTTLHMLLKSTDNQIFFLSVEDVKKDR